MDLKLNFRWSAFALLLLLAGHPWAVAVDLAALPPQPASITVKLAAEQIAAFHNYLTRARQEAGLPGVAVVLLQPGQPLLLEGFGQRNSAPDAPVTADTRFALGPATEAFTSLLLARLDTQNILSFDGPATRCWDEFKLSDPDATRKVTLRHLLGMTAGVPERVDRLLNQSSAMPADLFTLLGQMPVTAQPGRVFAYSDASAAAAGYLAVYAANHHHAPAGGLPAGYAALAKTQLLDPLGMKRATFAAPSASSSDDEVVGHIRNAQGLWQSAPATGSNQGALLPALGLRASARDVASWLQVEVSGGLGPDGTQLVAEKSVQARWQPESSLEPRDYALGWAMQHYRGVEIVARLGEYDHQAELVAIFPRYRTAFALLVNGGGRPAAVFLQDALLNLADLLRESVP